MRWAGKGLEPSFDQGRPRSEQLVDLLVVPHAGTSRRQKVTKWGPGLLHQDHLRHQLNGRFPASGPGDLHVYALKFESHWVNRMALLGKWEDQRLTIPFWVPVVQRRRKNSSSRQGEWERWALGMCVEGRRVKKGLQGD